VFSSGAKPPSRPVLVTGTGEGLEGLEACQNNLGRSGQVAWERERKRRKQKKKKKKKRSLYCSIQDDS
jgi:hypothetical protein